MAKQLIGIDIEGIEPLVKKIDRLPQDVQDEIGNDVTKYLFNVVQQQPPPKSVTRKQAYGVTFFTEKQRRWFFAALRSGALTIPYRRTQAFRKAWQIIGSGINAILVNASDYGGYLMGPSEQSRMSKLIGWKTTDQILEDKADRIDRIAEGALKKAMNKR